MYYQGLLLFQRIRILFVLCYTFYMVKIQQQFICQDCGSAFAKWSGRCLSCGAWDSLVENQVSVNPKEIEVAIQKPQQITNVKNDRLTRFSTGVGEIDRVLGGGIVPGSLVLLSGDPGVGKSTLTLQLAGHVASTKSVLYISGEESAGQIGLRAKRLGVNTDRLEVLSSTDIYQADAHAKSGRYGLIIVDSIQTMVNSQSSSVAGSISQTTTCAHILLNAAKQYDTAFLVIGHVTKEGNLAGPKLLEHLVDVVLHLEGDRFGVLKILKGAKNRFGPTDEVGILEMKERGFSQVNSPSQVLLEERSNLPGSVIFATLEGSRPILVEVQALVSPSVFGYPKRTATGVDLNRLNLLAAVVTKRGGIDLSNQDIYVNIVGGIKITEPAVDLAIILALATAYYNICLPPKLVVFGEVGLSGEIRSVSLSQVRLKEAKRLGFGGAYVPRGVKSNNITTPATIGEVIQILRQLKTKK